MSLEQKFSDPRGAEHYNQADASANVRKVLDTTGRVFGHVDESLLVPKGSACGLRNSQKRVNRFVSRFCVYQNMCFGTVPKSLPSAYAEWIVYSGRLISPSRKQSQHNLEQGANSHIPSITTSALSRYTSPRT